LAVCIRTSFFFLAGRKVFRDFLRCEYSEENILFWLACEELKKEANPDVVEEKARFIYEDYISILSPKEVIIRE
jgi:regulator of G-protein signaling